MASKLAELRMQLETKLGDAAPDELSQVMVLQEQAEPLVKEGFAHLDANKLAEAATSIEALRKLLGIQTQAEPTATSAATAESKVVEPTASAATDEPKSTDVETPAADEAASTADELRKLLDGVWLSEGKVKARSVRRVKQQGESTWLRVVLTEGKNREIRRMLAKLGHKVMRLRRVAIGPIELDKLPKGKARRATEAEVAELRKLVAAANEKIEQARHRAENSRKEAQRAQKKTE